MRELFNNFEFWPIILFFILNLINVILGTMRSILTVKSTPFISMIINTVSYTFYSGIVKMVSGQDMTIVLITTALTNIIGVYIARFILDRTKKDKLWRISATVYHNVKIEPITSKLKEYNIEYNVIKIDNASILDIFSKTQGESTLIKEILDKPDIKYHVIEIDKKL